MPDGTLLNIFAEWPLTLFAGWVAGNAALATTGDNELLVMRSADGGKTWGLVETAARFPATLLRDPDGGAFLSVSWRVVRSAVAADGSVYVVWEEMAPGATSRIQVTRSTGGAWNAPVSVIEAPWQVFKPTVAVGPDGTVAVTFYDFRNDVAGVGGLTTDIWIRHSHDGGATWSADGHVAGPFDFRSVPTSSGNALRTGDYAGLAPLADGFGVLFQRGNPPETIGATDVFFARAVQRSRSSRRAQKPGTEVIPFHQGGRP